MSQNIYMLLDHKRDFWALIVQTVAPKDLIVSLNYTQDIAVSVMLNKFFFHVFFNLFILYWLRFFYTLWRYIKYDLK